MPRKSKAPNEEPKKPVNTQRYYLDAEAPWGGFINARLTDENADAFKSWLNTTVGKGYTETIDDMLGEGVKITLAFDQLNNCYVCSATGALCSETPRHRYSSTSRAGSIAESLAMTAWKHVILVAGDYSDFRPSKSGNQLAWG